MCTIYASLTPEFYLHHAILDKIWYVWQQKGGRYKYAFFRCMGDPMKKYKCPYSQNQLIDSKDLPGCVRVEYSDFASRNFEINHEWKNNEKLEECNNEEASRNMSDDNLG